MSVVIMSTGFNECFAVSQIFDMQSLLSLTLERDDLFTFSSLGQLSLLCFFADRLI